MRRDYVTVVSGPPRSGTSLVMQMLAAGGMPLLSDGLRLPDAGNPHGYHELDAVKRLHREPAFLDDAPGRAVKVVHPLVRHLPAGRDFGYRVLWLERDLLEVARSQRSLLAQLGRPPEDDLSEERVAEILAWQLGRAAAALDARADVRRLVVRHAGLLATPGAEAERVAAFLDGGLDRAAMVACVDPALHRSRRDG